MLKERPCALFDTPAQGMFKFILNRLTERTTWAGLVAIGTACGATIEPALSEQIIAVGLAVAGLIGVVTKDRKEDK